MILQVICSSSEALRRLSRRRLHPLRTLAARVYRDARAAELLMLFNPGSTPDGTLAEGALVRLADRETAQKWAAKKGINIVPRTDERTFAGTFVP